MSSMISPVSGVAVAEPTDKGTDDGEHVISEESISTGAVMLRNSSSSRWSSCFRNSTLSANVLSSFFFSLKKRSNERQKNCYPLSSDQSWLLTMSSSSASCLFSRSLFSAACLVLCRLRPSALASRSPLTWLSSLVMSSCSLLNRNSFSLEFDLNDPRATMLEQLCFNSWEILLEDRLKSWDVSCFGRLLFLCYKIFAQ